jgi:acetyltransferase-like isoleucine patch superfamily enzyme
MSEALPTQLSRWSEGELPPNVVVGENSIITGNLAFKRFCSKLGSALTLGKHCTMDGVQFSIGENGRLSVGDYCYFTNAVLLCEMEIRIGNYVVIGWNTNITDTDFHPLAPAERIADAIACSPLGKSYPRPKVLRKPVMIEDNVWIGPNATILKGVRIGAGAFVEAGSLVARDVPPHTRVVGNPAQVLGQIP